MLESQIIGVVPEKEIESELSVALRDQQMATSKKVEDTMIESHTQKLMTGWSPEGWSVPVDTAEELITELERQIWGFKDRHDRFIDAYIEIYLNQESHKCL